MDTLNFKNKNTFTRQIIEEPRKGVPKKDSDFDFIAVKVTSGDDVTLSLDNGTTQIITISEGECFSSKIASGAQPYVTISGTSTVEYITGT